MVVWEERVGEWGPGLLEALSRIEDPRKPLIAGVRGSLDAAAVSDGALVVRDASAGPRLYAIAQCRSGTPSWPTHTPGVQGSQTARAMAAQVARSASAGFVAVFAGRLGVDASSCRWVPCRSGLQVDVGIVVLDGKAQTSVSGLPGAGNPDRRVRLLDGRLEGVDHGKVAWCLPSQRKGPGPVPGE